MAVSMVIDRASPRTREAVVSTLETATAGGRCALPPTDDGALVTRGQTLVRASAYPLACERFDDALVVGVCGRTFDWPDPDSITAAVRLIAELNARSVVVVDDLLEALREDALHAETICEALAIFVALGHFARP